MSKKSETLLLGFVICFLSAIAYRIYGSLETSTMLDGVALVLLWLAAAE